VTFSELVLFIGLGAVVGFAGGLFAIGGALIAIPLLTAVFASTQHDSQGTAMVMALASASVTLVIYARKKLLRVRDGLIMPVCSTVMGLVSSQMVRYVNDRTLQRSFGAFLIVLAVFVWFGHLGEGDKSAPLPAPVQVGIGSLAGALSGLFVVGGALVSVPLLERGGVLAAASAGHGAAHARSRIGDRSRGLFLGGICEVGRSDRARGGRRRAGAARYTGGTRHEAATAEALLCPGAGQRGITARRRALNRC
jgi:uncharacterized membrane protein YfcA